MSTEHTFHIPVMGTAFTADSPLKVAHFGISSVIALADDVLLERLRKFYSEIHDLSYTEIKNNTRDYRADRITAYLDMVNKLVETKFNEFISSTAEKFDEIKTHFSMLPDTSKIKKEFNILISNPSFCFDNLSNWLKQNLTFGSIDVNIMTKVDKTNYFKREQLPSEYNDAHAALRGYANSKLASSVVFSAGMNPRLYGYITNFDDFFPDKNGYIKKKIILKVSDYRSALIQGRFLAKKGIWVSEYRIESGLNCGGHAFATDGYLMGPILAEFRDRREELVEDIDSICRLALENDNKIVPENKLQVKITAQGGVATPEEHNFLVDHYNLDTVGWGTPFLLVPEVTAVDQGTMKKLISANENDLYLSNISPLGVPFNSLRGASKDIERIKLIDEGKPGSTCPRRYLALSDEYGTQGVCTASRQFQRNKIKENGVSEELLEKTCLCMGLAATSLLKYDIKTKESQGVSICPGPNMAYFSNELSLTQMTQHIYKGIDGVVRQDRPNMFVNELVMYLDYLSKKIDEHRDNWNRKSEKYLTSFTSNMNDGIDYYQKMFHSIGPIFEDFKEDAIYSFKSAIKNISHMREEINILIKENQS